MTGRTQMSSELASILAGICGDGRFGHRQHINLAFVAAKEGSDPAALMCDWIKQIAASHHAPHKYHETITIAWAKIVAHHVALEARQTSTALEARQTSTTLEARQTSTTLEARQTSTVGDPAVTDFDTFIDRYPALLDKTLLTRHYSPARLASVTARTRWVTPDLVALPS